LGGFSAHATNLLPSAVWVLLDLRCLFLKEIRFEEGVVWVMVGD